LKGSSAISQGSIALFEGYVSGLFARGSGPFCQKSGKFAMIQGSFALFEGSLDVTGLFCHESSLGLFCCVAGLFGHRAVLLLGFTLTRMF